MKTKNKDTVEETWKFLAQLLDETGSWGSTDFQQSHAVELATIFGKHLPLWIRPSREEVDKCIEWEKLTGYKLL